MTFVAIVYSSGGGHTQTVAEHVKRGAEEVAGTCAELIKIVPAQIGSDGRWRDDAVMSRLAAADAIVFGAPTYMGSAHGLFKLFLEAGIVPWRSQEWKDKIAAGFTNSGARSGDKLVTLQQMSIFAAQMGMMWVSAGDLPGGNYTDGGFTDVNVNGSWLGLMTQSLNDGTAENAPHPGDRLSAERFGRRVARATARWAVGADQFPSQRIDAQENRRRNLAGIDEWRQFDD
ncbi:NAD(P)H dehydrogenase (quinone) [Pseudomonas sp. 478]|jgi:NAD(P)H dehydrogenase (quinone)|uniref:flavodoxin family protein n=1 Tax=unclassified Pseudomonas TaxID=196821 RepID=UPI000DAF4535|nr:MULTISPECIES: flavodoxin family protein [unclassified Pseudomonas]PZW89110.1 NAD(P)H dehydrogenase (quinone) [Pseudomonas sp. 478]TCV35955.1 NAD(P)H dehydrogenase (quinone) [Pseudomonas sp. 460]